MFKAAADSRDWYPERTPVLAMVIWAKGTVAALQ